MMVADLTDEQWEKLQPLLPPQKAWTGQPAAEHRRIVNGILWLHRTGAPLAIFQRYGNHRTISVGSIGGEKQGLATDMVKPDAASKRCSRKDRLGSPLCRWYGCTRPSACSWEKGGPEAQALGRSHGGFSTKVHES